MSATIVDRPMAQYQIPHRKPLPAQLVQPQPHSSQNLPPSTSVAPQHSHSRTASSGILPPSLINSQHPTSYQTNYQSNNMQAFGSGTRRTPSNATSSTSSTGTGGNGAHPVLNRASTSNSFNNVLRRSTSSRSSATNPAPSSYVALMRKQKATVWCDRAQHEDPRLAAAVRAAKARAVQDLSGGASYYGGTSGSRSSTGSSGVGGGGGLRSKIRHHGAQKATTYNPTANMTHSGAAVPMRLSASEVDEGDNDDSDSHYITAAGMVRRGEHQRTGSGRSSLGSGRKVHAPIGHSRFSQGSTSPNDAGGSPMEDLAEETPVQEDYRPRQGDYFTTTGGTGLSGGSGSSSETRENSFGGVGTMPQRQAAPEGKKTEDELRRRGSVDERSMTLSGMGVGRLVVANPDLSD
ncbi:MAG: hypothetical protein M1821_005876 [Bathelium mastoideum]|nr:MAG: hypothetical protein M1821_005876 [Bathelium mastoideum]